jgi:hypothetical protein
MTRPTDCKTFSRVTCECDCDAVLCVSVVSPGWMEASGCLVALTVFKTDVTGFLGQAGSIPVRLRHLPMKRPG